MIGCSGDDDEAETDSAAQETSATTGLPATPETEGEDPSTETSSPPTKTARTEPDETEPSVTLEVATTPPTSSDQVAGAPSGATGVRDTPVPLGDIADIGGGWRLQILGVTPSGAAAVAQANQFNEPPPPGSDFTLVEVALGYFGLDDPKSLFEPTISALGAANVELAEDCGVLPNQLDITLDVFAGGVVTGNICFVTTPEDVPNLQLYGSGDLFSGDDVFLAATGTPSESGRMATIPGIQDGAAASEAWRSPVPVGTSADIGDGWSATVSSPAYDVTDAVAAENQFNEPPPEGFRFVAVDLALTFNGEGSDNGFTVATKAVSTGNVQLGGNCGVVPNQIDPAVDVFTGGTIAGAACFIVPADQIAGLVAYLVGGFSAAPTMFATS